MRKENGMRRELFRMTFVAALLMFLTVQTGMVRAGGDIDVFVASAKGGILDEVEDQLKQGVDIDAQDSNGETALVEAAQQGNVDIVKLLLEKGAKIEGAERGGWNALILACQNGHLEISRLLLDKGANVNAANEKTRDRAGLGLPERSFGISPALGG